MLVKLRGQQGFTLIELMIVILVISIMAGLAMASFNSSPIKQLNKESKRLRALILLARDEAIFRSRPLALEFFPDHYHFLQYGEEKKWEKLKDKQLVMHRLSGGLRVAVYRDDLLLEMADPELLEKNDSDLTPTPQVFFLPTGETSPFEIEFELPAKALLRIGFDANGKSTLVSSQVF